MHPLSLSPSLSSWARSLPATGFFEEVSPGRFRLLVSQSRLADRLGYKPGSGALSRRLQRLEETGVLVSRRPFVLDLSLLDPSPVAAPASSESAPISSDDLSLATLLERAIERGLETLALRLLEELLPSARTRASPLTIPRSEATFSARSERITESSSRSVYRETALTPRLSARNAQTVHAPHRSAADMREILAPLLDECALRGLPGITNMPGLLTALTGVPDQQVERAAGEVLRQLQAGALIHSPVGLLTSLLSEPGAG